MGPATAGVSGNKGWALSRFVLGKLPLSRKLLSCRFPFNLRLPSRVWVRGEVDSADPSHKASCYQGQRAVDGAAARFRRGFRARSLHLPAVPAISQSGGDLTLSQFSIGGQGKHTKSLLFLDHECQLSLSASRTPRPPFPAERGAARQPPAVAPTPTSSLLMGTDGCKRFPISRRFSNRSASSFIRSASHLRMASSMRRRTFLI